MLRRCPEKPERRHGAERMYGRESYGPCAASSGFEAIRAPDLLSNAFSFEPPEQPSFMASANNARSSESRETPIVASRNVPMSSSPALPRSLDFIPSVRFALRRRSMRQPSREKMPPERLVHILTTLHDRFDQTFLKFDVAQIHAGAARMVRGYECAEEGRVTSTQPI